MSSNQEVLQLAQMHLECLNEAWNEYNSLLKNLTNERMLVVHNEIHTRLWASIYLVQGVWTGVPLTSDQCATVAEAGAYDDPNEELEDDDGEIPAVMGKH